jgi:EAL domain-containing protein (putative c-di-GMP-specific phosphodiesterase class I)
MGLDNDLQGAVARGELTAYYQPQIDLGTDRIVAVEALARWEHPTKGLLPPRDFIPRAEQSGLIHEIGGFMMETGCESGAEWHDNGLDLEVAVNVSAVQLADPAFLGGLSDLLVTHAMPPHLLTIEITESQLIRDVPSVATRLGEVADLGVGISIDDFGTGHSSLSRLRELPFSELKVDQSLIRDGDEARLSLVAIMIGLIRDRGVRVVAEGVETLEQLHRVRDFGCERAQGFFVSRPVPKSGIDSLVGA